MMAHRIDLELTSARPDGTWTWRAAGARQPKGSLDTSLLYEGAAVGDVVRADAELGLEGTTIVRLYPPRERRSEPERLVVLGSAGTSPGVTSSLVSKARRAPGRHEREGRGEREGRREHEGSRPSPRPDARSQGAGAPHGARPRGASAGSERVRPEQGPGRRPDIEAASPAASRATAGTGPATRARGATKPAARPTAREGAGAAGARDTRRDGGHRSDRPAPGSGGPGGIRRGPPRLVPGSAHRAAALAALPPEQRPIAEQILRGGLAAVRQAIDAQNAELRAQGRPEVGGEELLALAEQLLGSLKAAAWRDRAEAALAAGDDLALRDLRSVVASADGATRDDTGRMLATKLREALDSRAAQVRQRWVDETAAALDGDKILRALRTSSRPPDPGSRLPAELAVRLSRAAGEAMTPDTPPDRWASLLEAAASSPVRRTVKPVGLPREPGDPLLAAVRHASGRIPALAALLGINMPPPPSAPMGASAKARPRPMASQGTQA